MAANPGSLPHGGPIKRTSFSSFPGNSASLFLEKNKAGIRGSTPDSEALASSDDEQDHYHRLPSINQNLGQRPARRPSWLSDIQQAPQRKGSLNGSGTFSPTNSHPATPATDQNWAPGVAAPTMGRGHAGSVSFPWGNAIWTSESQRGPPNRLTEVLPSPTSLVPPGSAGFYGEEPMLSPPSRRGSTAESAIPFAIPLQPTLKTYRSQSYSVGQLDPEVSQIPTGQFFNGRTRTGAPYGGLQHRPSRPSMLGEMPHDSTLLGQLREVEDDDESSTGSEAGVQLSTTQAQTIEQLAMENAMLRQAAAEQLESSRGRNRAVTTNSTSQGGRSANQGYNQRIQEAVPEEAENALYDLDDPETNHLYSYTDIHGRRATEYIAKGRQFSVAGIPENRTLESVKKGHWQSSLGFGGLGDPPQSRRHSFAEVPTRQASLSSTSESQKSFAAAGSGHRAAGGSGGLGSPPVYSEGLSRPSQGDPSEYQQFRIRHKLQEQALELEHLRDRNFAVSYFSGIDSSIRSGDCLSTTLSPTALNPIYQTHSPCGRSQHPGHQPRPNQLLYIVTFKACRADVFYVQEGNGLQIKPGELVIVEADRGTDLGTVAEYNIPWSKAKEMKERYTEEHYRWLMIFSRHGQDGTPAGANPNGQPANSNGTGIRNGPNGGLGNMGASDAAGPDLKPKMIKRLAQAHEIQTLRDKEGNEAKAKRVCQQKVVEHRLNMEILDAEFQMDWKKLTFYYFADSYINFNPLVTDLFKIYKTRIWMSAINPASFVTPVAGLQLPSGLGPGAFNSESDRYSTHHQQQHEPTYSVPGSSAQTQGAFERLWDTNANPGVAPLPFGHIYSQPFQPQDVDNRHLDQSPMDYRTGGQHAATPQARYHHIPYHLEGLHPSQYGLRPASSTEGIRKTHAIGNDWKQSFQGLSLGS